MKIKTNIVKLLAVLAILGSLVAIAAVPAGAVAASVSPATGSGTVGASFSITASNFAGTSILTAKFDGVTLTTAPTTVTTDASGTATFAVLIPTSTAGAHIISVTDGVNTATATYTVLGKVTVTPTSGPVGTSVMVTGTGFSGAGVTADVTMTDGVTTKSVAAGVAIDSTGSFTATGTVPAFAAGAKTISASDGAGNTASTTATFTVKPTLAVNPTSGLPGSLTTITGSGWPDGPITVTFAGQAWVTVNASGGLITDGANKQIPIAASPGIKTVVGTSGAFTGSATFTVSPRALTITPSSGPAGTQVLIMGSNMTPGGTIAVGALTFGGVAWNTAVINIDSTGSISPTTLRVPATAALGANTVMAADSGSLIAAGIFTETASTIAVTPTFGPKGSSVTFSGTGWVTGVMVTIAFAGTNLTTVPDSAGNIAAAMGVPAAAAVGQNTITATDAYSNSALVKFTVPPAALTVTPTAGTAGTSVTVSGTGFAAYTAITIKIGTYTFLQQPLSDALGSFTATITVPGLAPGTQSISAGDGVNNVTAFFTVSSAPPTAASALSGISTQLIRVWGYSDGTWYLYDPADAAGSDLTSLTSGKGYWIDVNASCTLIYGGYSYALSSGWNLIGWR